jgi:hypothetical protein
MSRRKNNQQRNLSNGTSEYDEARFASDSSSSVNNYNPITMINKEINSEECRRLLMKVDKMREILQMEKISLPQIVVVGDQSVDQISWCLKLTRKSFV